MNSAAHELASGRRSFRVSAMVLILVAVFFAGCGNDPPPDTVRATVARVHDAIDTHDVSSLCDELSAQARLVLGRSGHQPVTTCEQDVREVLGWMKTDPSTARASVVATRQRGSRSWARLRSDQRARTFTLPLSREDGRWKLDGLYDARLSQIQARGTFAETRLMREPSVPAPRPARSATIAVTDATTRQRCDPVITNDFPSVSGGCLIEVAGRSVALSVQTPFGTIPFHHCDVSFYLQVDSGGSGWVSNYDADGKLLCDDADVCQTKGRRKLPWRARLDSTLTAGEFTLTVFDMCMNTCLGEFVGDWRVTMTDAGNRWTVDARQTMVGETGWEFDGTLSSDARTVDIKPAPGH